MRSKVLILDIETAPMQSYLWSLWDKFTPTNFVISDWYVLTWAAKWLDDEEIFSDSLANYDVGPEEDLPIIKTLYQLLDEAEVVIAHNGKRFDVPKLNTRFLMNGITPPSPYKLLDTLQVLKRNFKFSSNKLDFVASALLGEGKLDRKFHGFDLWKECLNGNEEAWAEMLEYNEKDVDILERVYLYLRPWMDNHPNIPLIEGKFDRPRCPKCGSDRIHMRGTYTTSTGKYQRYVCLDCGGWNRERFTTVSSEDGKKVMRNVSNV